VIPLFAVIPVKNQLRYTQPLVEELLAQQELIRLYLIDNGCTDGTDRWARELEERDETLVWLKMHGEGIHAMWNRGLDLAHALIGSRPHSVAILNNDLSIGPSFLSMLDHGMRLSEKVMVAGANYDGRDFKGPIEPTAQICAGRYDGTGGLPGFAMMVRGEWGYRFPTNMTWWFGDNDLILSAVTQGFGCVLVRDAHCKHLDGGGRTAGDWGSPEMMPILRADHRAFTEKWKEVLR